MSRARQKQFFQQSFALATVPRWKLAFEALDKFHYHNNSFTNDFIFSLCRLSIKGHPAFHFLKYAVSSGCLHSQMDLCWQNYSWSRALRLNQDYSHESSSFFCYMHCSQWSHVLRLCHFHSLHFSTVSCTTVHIFPARSTLQRRFFQIGFS